MDESTTGATFLHTAVVCPFGRFILASFNSFLAVVRINTDGLEIASKINCDALKALTAIGNDIFIGLCPLFSDEETDSKIT